MKHFKLLVLLLAIFSIISCGANRTGTEVEGSLDIEDAPDWINEGVDIIDNQDGKLIHATGIAPMRKGVDISLQRDQADNRALATLAKTLSVFMDVAAEDFTTSESMNKQQASVLQRNIRTQSKVLLKGARIVKRHTNKATDCFVGMFCEKEPQHGTIYSLAEINLEQIKQMSKNLKTLNADFRDYFATNAEESFQKYKTQNDK
jgi:hypothetical protein